MIITNSTYDKFYFDLLLSFLGSLHTNSPDHDMIVYLINEYPEEVVSKLKKGFPKYDFREREIEMVDDRGISLILDRIFVLKDYLEKEKKDVAWIDTDVIVRTDLSEFLEIKPGQLKILYREKSGLWGKNVPERVKFNAGIFNLGYSENILEFISSWHDKLSKNMVWGNGQLELHRTYEKYSKKIDLVKMPEKFNTLGDSTNPNCFVDNAVMWHCKKLHFENEKFHKEFKRYYKIGKRMFDGGSND